MNSETFDVFSVPNKDYALLDDGITLKSFLKAPCRKSRKPNLEFSTITEVIADLYVLHLFRNPEIFDVFSVPNEDYVHSDASVTLKSFLKASCRKSRKPNFEFSTITEVIADLYVLHLFRNPEIFDVFSVPNEDYVHSDASVTLKSFLKASCRKSRKPNFDFFIITEVISILRVLDLF